MKARSIRKRFSLSDGQKYMSLSGKLRTIKKENENEYSLVNEEGETYYTASYFGIKRYIKSFKFQLLKG